MNLARPYTPLPGQSAFHASDALIKYYCGALGAGKSTTLCVEALMLSVEYPGNVGMLTRSTLPELRSTTLQRFLDYCPEDLIIEHQKNERTIVLRSSGEKPSLIYYHPYDEVARFKSLDLGWWAADEADSMPEDIFLMLVGRLRCPGVRHSGMLASNPPTLQHWLYKRFFESTDPQFALFRAKTQDNAVNLPPGYVERLAKAYPSDWRKRYLDGEPGTLMDGTAVFPDFREDLHVRGCMHKQGRTLLRGWDFGYHFPFCIWAEFDEFGRFMILDCLSGRDEDLEIFAKRVILRTNERFPQAKIDDFCDIAGIQKKDSGKSSVQTLNDMRIYPRYRYSKIEERASEIRKLMREIIHREPAFQVHPGCREVIDSLIGYHYRKSKDGFSLDEPFKDNIHDHAIDTCGIILSNTSMIGSQDLQSRDDVNIVEPSYFKSRVKGRSRCQGGKRTFEPY